jgi:hypothetical protein
VQQVEQSRAGVLNARFRGMHFHVGKLGDLQRERRVGDLEHHVAELGAGRHVHQLQQHLGERVGLAQLGRRTLELQAEGVIEGIAAVQIGDAQDVLGELDGVGRG